MHAEKTLDEVVAFYDRGGIKNPWLSSDVKPLKLTAQEQKDLVAFLRSLAGEIDPEVQPPGDSPDRLEDHLTARADQTCSPPRSAERSLIASWHTSQRNR
jgi:hypothetical protein